MRNRIGTMITETVVVYLPGRTIKGVLVGEHKDCLVLRHASVLAPEAGQDQAVAGEVVIPRPLPDGSFLQRPNVTP